MENIQELLDEISRAADLRKKETLRLIKYAKIVLQQVAEISKESPGHVAIKGESNYDHSEVEKYLIAENGEIKLADISWYGYVEETILDETIIAYAPKTWSKYRISDGKYEELPKGEMIYFPSQVNRIQTRYGEYKEWDNIHEPRKWFETLERVEKEPESITRLLWVEVVRNIPELVSAMGKKENKEKNNISKFADIAEKMAKLFK